MKKDILSTVNRSKPSTIAEEWDCLVTDCEARQERLTEWQQEFISSIRTQLERGKDLSAKQDQILSEIWEKATARG